MPIRDEVRIQNATTRIVRHDAQKKGCPDIPDSP